MYTINIYMKEFSGHNDSPLTLVLTRQSINDRIIKQGSERYSNVLDPHVLYATVGQRLNSLRIHKSPLTSRDLIDMLIVDPALKNNTEIHIDVLWNGEMKCHMPGNFLENGCTLGLLLSVRCCSWLVLYPMCSNTIIHDDYLCFVELRHSTLASNNKL